jgi:hypothetical protein
VAPRARSTGDGGKAARAHDCRYVLRFSPAIEPRFNFHGADVVAVLERVGREVGFPAAIRVDQGSEFVSRDLDLWAYQRSVTLDFSRPGFIESFNGKFRAECLNTGSPTTTVTQNPSTAAEAPNVKDQSPRTISKAMIHETTRLKDDATGWAHKLQELELDLNLQLDLKKNQDLEATGKDINECLVVLRAAAGRLAPDAETRVTLRKQEVAVRDHAIRAEVHLDPEIRKTAGYFQQKTTELHALNRSFEEIRTRLVTQIDRLAELKIQLGIVTAAQIGEAVKGGEVSLDDIQGITEDARRIAADLDGFGRASAVTTEPAEAVKPVEVAKPAEVKESIPRNLRNGREPAFAEKKRSGRLGLFDRPGRRGAALRHCRYNRTSRRAY